MTTATYHGSAQFNALAGDSTVAGLINSYLEGRSARGTAAEAGMPSVSNLAISQAPSGIEAGRS